MYRPLQKAAIAPAMPANRFAGRKADAQGETVPPPVDSMARDIALTVYAGARSTTPHDQTETAWPELGNEIVALCRDESAATDKRDLPAFGLYKLKQGTTRAAANVLTMSRVIVLDLDGVAIEPLRARLRELGLAAIVHGSPSDDPAGVRKARAYVLADREHLPSEAGAMRRGLAALLGVAHDESCSNADRLWFCGRMAGTLPRYCERFEGRSVVLAELPAVAPASAAALAAAPVASAAAPVASAAAPDRIDPAYDAASWAVLGALGSWRDYDGRKHAICGAIGGLVRKTPGWTRERLEQLVRAWLPAEEPSVDVAAGVAWSVAAFDKPAEEVSGTESLAAVVGQRCACAIEQALMLPYRARQEGPREASGADTGGANGYSIIVDSDWRNPQPLVYVVPALELAPGKVSVVQGFAYTSKTPFALLLAVCVAAGRPFLGCAVEQRRVAYLDHEGGLLTRERAMRICRGLGVDVDALPLHLFTPTAQFSIDYLEELERFVREHDVGMLALDTYASAFPAGDGGFNESAFRCWADALGRLSAATGCLIVVLIHETKTARGQEGVRGISGHGSLAGAVQAAISLERADEAKPNEITVRCARATRRGFEPFVVRWTDGDGDALIATRVGANASATAKGQSIAVRNRATAANVREAGEAIMRSAPAVMTSRKELTERGGCGRNAGLLAIMRLVKAGLLQECGEHYQMTDGGRAAGAVEIALALGFIAGYQR
jgi:hypothetical protein